MHCVNENRSYSEAYLSLSKEPGWGVAFYLGKTHVRVYEQSLYLLCALQHFSPRCLIHVERCENNRRVYADLPLKSFYALLSEREVEYFDSGYGIRWLSDLDASGFAFEHWREQVLQSQNLSEVS